MFNLVMNTCIFRKTLFNFCVFIIFLGILPFDAIAGNVVVANRGTGDISIIDTSTDQVTDTIALPGGPNPPEPMYIVSTVAHNRIFVGDRANNRIVVYRGSDFSFETTIPAGNGVFHMWADPPGKQLWVVNDIDLSVTVIDPRKLQVLSTVLMPSDLIILDAKPHDVMLNDKGSFAYVSFLNVNGSDVVVQFDTNSFTEVDRAFVGKDPHLFYSKKRDQLYIPCQNSDSIFVLRGETLTFIAEIFVPGAHGVFVTTNNKRLYTTNLPGGGTDAVFTVSTRTNSLIGGPVNTPFAVPHNLSMTPNGRKIYVTHSGANDRVSVFEVSESNPVPRFLTSIIVGDNPFGLGYSN